MEPQSPFKVPPVPGYPLQPASPERINQNRVPQSPSTESLKSESRHHRQSSDVASRVAFLNSLSRPGTPTTPTMQPQSASASAALQRAILGREEAENGLYMAHAKLEEAESRERKISERVESLMEDLQSLKERQAHERQVFEKEVRKARKDAFRAGSALVKLQEELKEARADSWSSKQDLKRERHDKEIAKQEAFERAYTLSSMMEETESLKEKVRSMEAEVEADRLHREADELQEENTVLHLIPEPGQASTRQSVSSTEQLQLGQQDSVSFADPSLLAPAKQQKPDAFEEIEKLQELVKTLNCKLEEQDLVLKQKTEREKALYQEQQREKVEQKTREARTKKRLVEAARLARHMQCQRRYEHFEEDHGFNDDDMLDLDVWFLAPSDFVDSELHTKAKAVFRALVAVGNAQLPTGMTLEAAKEAGLKYRDLLTPQERKARDELAKREGRKFWKVLKKTGIQRKHVQAVYGSASNPDKWNRPAYKRTVKALVDLKKLKFNMTLDENFTIANYLRLSEAGTTEPGIETMWEALEEILQINEHDRSGDIRLASLDVPEEEEQPKPLKTAPPKAASESKQPAVVHSPTSGTFRVLKGSPPPTQGREMSAEPNVDNPALSQENEPAANPTSHGIKAELHLHEPRVETSDHTNSNAKAESAILPVTSSVPVKAEQEQELLEANPESQQSSATASQLFDPFVNENTEFRTDSQDEELTFQPAQFQALSSSLQPALQESPIRRVPISPAAPSTPSPQNHKAAQPSTTTTSPSHSPALDSTPTLSPVRPARPTSQLTTTTTTTIPLRGLDENTNNNNDPDHEEQTLPGTPISKEAALAQIRARRDRARSVVLKDAKSAPGTPARRGLVGGLVNGGSKSVGRERGREFSVRSNAF
ncbi:MAG: hypothetical protein Q9227_000276 [Pyrenula ochraceoflavens]